MAAIGFKFPRVSAVVAVLLVVTASEAPGLIIEREDDSVTYTTPADDPGWANVGVCSGWTAVYLGRGWVLTAAHVGASRIDLEGVVYAADMGSRETILNPDASAADLMLFRLDSEPNLPALEISTESPPVGSEIVLVGSGLGRGEKTAGRGRVGFRWKEPSIKRWGTSTVHELVHDRSVGNTDVFATRFSLAKTAHEAHAAHGDSGGAAFVRHEGRWQLVGIILAVDSHRGQPSRSAAYGNQTFIADLARYRESILRITGAFSD